MSTLERSPNECDAIHNHLKAQNIIPDTGDASTNGQINPRELLNACASLNFRLAAPDYGNMNRTKAQSCCFYPSVGWLLSTCLEVLPWTSSTLTLLRDLADEYAPLKLSDEASDDSEQLPEQEVLAKELGSTFQVEIAAKGVPTPIYQWMKLPCSDGDTWENTGQPIAIFINEQSK